MTADKIIDEMAEKPDDEGKNEESHDQEEAKANEAQEDEEELNEMTAKVQDVDLDAEADADAQTDDPTTDQSEEGPATNGGIPKEENQEPKVILDLTLQREIHLEKRHVTDEDAAPILAPAIEKSTVLQLLSLHENGFTLADGQLTSAIMASQTLRTLNLGDNRIGSEGATRLSEVLKVTQSLITMNLVGNDLGCDGAKALSEGLGVNTTLQNLSLSDNLIGSHGAARLADALKKNATLLALDVGCNPDIGEHGTERIAEALHVNKSLRELNMMCVGMGDEGADALAITITKNTTLTKLWVNGNDINDDGGTKLAQALENFDANQDSCIKELWFNGNPVSTKIYMKLVWALEGRKKRGRKVPWEEHARIVGMFRKEPDSRGEEEKEEDGVGDS